MNCQLLFGSQALVYPNTCWLSIPFALFQTDPKKEILSDILLPSTEYREVGTFKHCMIEHPGGEANDRQSYYGLLGCFTAVKLGGCRVPMASL